MKKQPLKIGPAERPMRLSDTDMIPTDCHRCVLRLNGRCFHGLKEGQYWDLVMAVKENPDVDPKQHIDGVCPEMLMWLYNLADGTNDPNIMWENYHLFVSRLQASKDYAKYSRLAAEVQEAHAAGMLGDEEMDRLERRELSMRQQWQSLHDDTLKSISRRNEREARKNIPLQIEKISLVQIHQLVDRAKKEEDQKVIDVDSETH